MKIEILWAMFLVTTAISAVVARDIPLGPDLEDDDFMISEEENVMDYWNYTAELNTDRVRSHGVENLHCQHNVQYMEHPTCCSMYVQCSGSGSTPIQQVCAPGTAWSQSASTCVHISTTNCGKIDPVSPSAPTSCFCGIANPTNRIVDGVEVQPEGKYPWQVGIGKAGYTPLFNCGGSIINSKFILTAAHCVYKFNANQKVNVYIGVHDTDAMLTKDNIKTVKEIIIHPCYNNLTDDYDFALLELNNPIVFDDAMAIRPVCLPDDDSRTYKDEMATVAGWGQKMYNDKNAISNILLEVDVKILDNNNCGNYRTGRITDNMLCAGDRVNGGKNTCTGDSGGPLVFKENDKYVQVGVVSFARECALKDYASVFGRVSKVLDWIKAKSADGQYCDNMIP